MNVIDLFSGVGGLSSGFLKANYDVILANEFDEKIANSYSINHPDTLMINEDIEVFAKDIDGLIEKSMSTFSNQKRALDIKEKLNNVNVIIGGPPCQGFSMAGKRIRKNHGFIEDPRNYLFKYYFEIIKKFEPTFFVFENVPGLINMNKGDILKEIIDIFSEPSFFQGKGYKVTYSVVDASKIGVPQKRKRVIIIGSKESEINLSKEIEEYINSHKVPTNVNVHDAISDLNFLESAEDNITYTYPVPATTKYQIQRRNGAKYLVNHSAPKHDSKTLERIRLIKPGENFRSLADSHLIKSVHSGSYGRLKWTQQSPTITTRFDTPSAGRVIHPERHRALTPREAARLQSFDDTFKFVGNKSSVGKQIGNAVPPLLAYVLAQIIMKHSIS